MKSTEIQPNEYAPFYSNYINVVGDVDLFEVLETSANEFLNTLKNLPEDKFNYSYAEGKWTIKELLQHIIDAERVFNYRALRFARNDSTNLAGFDEDWFVDNSNGDDREVNELLDEITTVRKATIALFKSFKQEMLFMKGTADNCEISVRAIGFIIAGHQIHHHNIIKERYL